MLIYYYYLLFFHHVMNYSTPFIFSHLSAPDWDNRRCLLCRRRTSQKGWESCKTNSSHGPEDDGAFRGSVDSWWEAHKGEFPFILCLACLLLVHIFTGDNITHSKMQYGIWCWCLYSSTNTDITEEFRVGLVVWKIMLQFALCAGLSWYLWQKDECKSGWRTRVSCIMDKGRLMNDI